MSFSFLIRITFISFTLFFLSPGSQACITLTKRPISVPNTSYFGVNNLAFDHTPRGLALQIDEDILFYNPVSKKWCFKDDQSEDNICLPVGQPNLYMTDPKNPRKKTAKLDILPDGSVRISSVKAVVTGSTVDYVVDTSKPVMHILSGLSYTSQSCNRSNGMCSAFQYGGRLYAHVFDRPGGTLLGSASYEAASSLNMNPSWNGNRPDETFAVPTTSRTRGISIPPPATQLIGQRAQFRPDCHSKDRVVPQPGVSPQGGSSSSQGSSGAGGIDN